MKHACTTTIFLLLIFSFTAAGKEPLFLGVNITPTWAAASDKNSNLTYQPWVLCYEAGINMMTPVSPNIFAKAGLGYRKSSMVISSDYLFSSSSNPPDEVKFSYHFISLPLSINFGPKDILKRKIGYYFSTGVTFSHLYQGTSDYSDQKWTPEDFDVTMSLKAGAGMYFHPSDKVLLLIEPAYRFDLFGMYDNLRFQTILLTLECSFDLR